MRTFCKLTAQSPAASYVPLPRFLLQDEALRDISNDAKVLYALLLDRASISRQNGYVEPDELPEYIQENRGWWGDAIKTSVNGRKENIVWGSGLWVFDREKLSDDTLVDFKEKIKASLKVAVDAGIISEPEITVMRSNDQLSFILTFTDDEPLQFEGF